MSRFMLISFAMCLFFMIFGSLHAFTLRLPSLRLRKSFVSVHQSPRQSLQMVTVPPDEQNRVSAKTEFNEVIQSIKDRFNRAVDNSKVETTLVGAAKGEQWLVLQTACVGVLILGTAFLNPILGWSLNLASSGFLLFGALLFVGAIKELGNDISFLSPPVANTLKTEGVYNIVRHPMYSAAFFLCAGFALLTMDTWRILATLLLLYASNKRAENEELYLRDKFGKDYQEYEDKVLDKLIPLWL